MITRDTRHHRHKVTFISVLCRLQRYHALPCPANRLTPVLTYHYPPVLLAQKKSLGTWRQYRMSPLIHRLITCTHTQLTRGILKNAHSQNSDLPSLYWAQCNHLEHYNHLATITAITAITGNTENTAITLSESHQVNQSLGTLQSLSSLGTLQSLSSLGTLQSLSSLTTL